MGSYVRIGDQAPDFTAETTQGTIRFHEWIGHNWCVFFSHPKDFTPVCTTELGYAAKMKKEFDKRNTKIIALSIGTVEDHKHWIPDINLSQNTTVEYPLIGDKDKKIASLYGMVHPNESETTTVRTVFIIDPHKKIRLMIAYPASTGRNFDELLRVIDALQLTDDQKVATPVNWHHGAECIILPSITDPNEIKELFPQGYREVLPYLRYTQVHEKSLS